MQCSAGSNLAHWYSCTIALASKARRISGHGVEPSTIIHSVLRLVQYGTLWGYTAVFAQAAAAAISLPSAPSCDVYSDPSDSCLGLYRVYVLAFGVVVLPLSLLPVKEQISFQILNTVLRFVCAGIMIWTSVARL